MHGMGVMHGAPDCLSVLVLIFLVAIDGINQEMCEVVDQGELVAKSVATGGQPPATHARKVLPRNIYSLCNSAVGRIERSKAADQSFGDRAFGLIGLVIPQSVIEASRQRITALVVAFAVAQYGIDLALIARRAPGPIVVLQFQSAQQASGRGLGGAGRQEPLKSPHAACQGDLIIDGIGVTDVSRADRRKISLGRIIRALAVTDIGGKLRNQEVQIRVALTVRVGWLVDRHLIDICRKVGAVIEVISAHQVLICLAFAAVQSDDGPKNRLEYQWPGR